MTRPHHPIQIDWNGWRIIPSRNPPVDLYSRVAPPENWPKIINVELLTNPRVRELQEGLGLVRSEDIKGGATQNWILAPFTYLNPEGGRFCDGSFGFCFQTREFATALTHSIQLREKFLQRTQEPAIDIHMRVLRTKIKGEFDDVTDNRNLTSEGKRRQYGLERAKEGCNGIFFHSPILRGEECLEAFRPRVFTKAIQERHLTYTWDGERISEVYDFSNGKMIDLDYISEKHEVRHFEREIVGRR